MKCSQIILMAYSAQQCICSSVIRFKILPNESGNVFGAFARQSFNATLAEIRTSEGQWFSPPDVVAILP